MLLCENRRFFRQLLLCCGGPAVGESDVGSVDRRLQTVGTACGGTRAVERRLRGVTGTLCRRFTSEDFFEQVNGMLGTIVRIGWAVGLCLTVAETAVGQGSWADALVDRKSIDFGVVATGADTAQVVTIRNTTQATVHISSVTTACTCAQAGQPSATLLQPGESATIEVRINTRQFSKKRDTSMTIFFDSPQYASVLIPISAYIRTDVVFDPGMVRFGNVEYGANAQVTVKVAYAGRPDWKILDVKMGSADLSATLKETRRDAGYVDYELTMKLSSSAQPQRLRDLVTLVTDDAANPHVPLMVEGIVIPDISISPESVQIRPLSPGESTTVRVVIKGSKPFVIEDVNCAGMSDCFEVRLEPKTNKLCFVDIKFVAPKSRENSQSR